MVKADPGPCRAAFYKFYYNPNTGNCHKFTYGGCRGNKNRYDSVEECMSHCSMDSKDAYRNLSVSTTCKHTGDTDILGIFQYDVQQGGNHWSFIVPEDA